MDIIHTNPGNYGTSTGSGTVDLWPNYSADDGMQPGCPRGKFDMFTPEGEILPSASLHTLNKLELKKPRPPQFASLWSRHLGFEICRCRQSIRILYGFIPDLCSHDRAWRYLVESIQSSTGFPAAAAESYEAWLRLREPPSKIIYMGDLINTR